MMQAVRSRARKLVSRTEVTQAVRFWLGLCCDDPAKLALPSVRIGAANQLAANGANPRQIQQVNRWKSFMVYVRKDNDLNDLRQTSIL